MNTNSRAGSAGMILLNKKVFAHFAGPNSVRPRVSAAGPCTLGLRLSALCYLLFQGGYAFKGKT
jgi:hypothetical protein